MSFGIGNAHDALAIEPDVVLLFERFKRAIIFVIVCPRLFPWTRQREGVRQGSVLRIVRFIPWKKETQRRGL